MQRHYQRRCLAALTRLRISEHCQHLLHLLRTAPGTLRRSLPCEGSDAIGAKRTCRERLERVDLTKMTPVGMSASLRSRPNLAPQRFDAVCHSTTHNSRPEQVQQTRLRPHCRGCTSRASCMSLLVAPRSGRRLLSSFACLRHLTFQPEDRKRHLCSR